MKASRGLVLLIGLGLIPLLLGLFGYRFNLSASLPPGVYRISPEPATRGAIVHACLPEEVAQFAMRRAYLGPGSCKGGVRPIGKVVLAVAGDVVVLSREEIRVNGRRVPNSMTVAKDSRGRPLPHFPWGAYHLGPGEFWLFSPYHRSAYDSRYFGPVHQSDIISVLRPLWRRDPASIDGLPSTWQGSSMLRARPSHDTP